MRPFLIRLIEVPAITDPATLGYLAGIIDGEGWISFVNATDPAQRRWTLGVANTDYALMEFLTETIGGYVQHRGLRHGRLTARKPSYQWSLQRSSDVMSVLMDVHPYMVVKKQRALQVIDEILGWYTWGDEDRPYDNGPFLQFARPIQSE